MLGDHRKNGFNRVARGARKQIGAGAGLCESGDTDDDQVDRYDVFNSCGISRIRIPAMRATSGVIWARVMVIGVS